MDNISLIAIFFILILLILIISNYNSISNNIESFENNFTEDKCCCNENEINKCNQYGKSCVCDYIEKNKYLCQNPY